MATRTETHTKEVKIRSCDFCNKESDSWRVKKCDLCGQDICGACAIWSDSQSLEDGCYSSDYPDYFCKPCWDKGQELRKQIHVIRQDALCEEEVLWQAWKTLCNYND